ncbi:fimbrillin family protein [Elizabethkingia anophelis]
MRNKIANFKALNILPIAAFLFITNSCRSHDTDNNLNKETLANGISFNLINDDFNNEENGLKSVASLNGTNANKANILNQNFTSGPFDITTELSLKTSALGTFAQANTKFNTVADKLGGPTNTNAIKYVVVVYKPDGTYLGQEVGDASTPNQKMFGNLNLIGNQPYTFVTYSLGSTTPPPSAPTTNLNMAELNINGLTGSETDSDLMFAINENVILSGSNTPLDVHLKHKFTKITISIDNSDATGTVKGGYPLASESSTGATGIISDFYTDCSIRFKDGMKIGAVTGTSSLGTSTANGIKTTGQSFIINTGAMSNYTGTITLPANSIVIGKDSNAQPLVININGSGTGLMPGYAYTLKLKFNSDRYVDASGVTKTQGESDALYAVIGGYKWDRYNLGVVNRNPTLNNPDQIPSIQDLHGGYYQFGNKQPIADAASTTNYKNINWNGNPAANNSWDANSPNNPCFPGYKVPTEAELKILLNNTSQKIIGNTTSNTFGQMNNYSAAGVYTSKKNQNVRLSIPISGYADLTVGSNSAPFQPGDIRGRANSMHLGSSTFNSTTSKISILQYSAISYFGGGSGQGSGGAQKVIGRSIRCIAE